ncbi:carbohydrate ABC transporter permease [Limimaricola litoreus]|uniref:Carbohydrate ABC transporter permease n=1 Tax=Limimaricola litoreus TaxID=2955316 RepID=A0A9X2G017_9RHOB|nr:carbohydrate ABC transporter permease [Limimaricola litoreus]MCP1170633.1 carbohydrate ABC transporter permease [Limimaricola litoreus]
MLLRKMPWPAFRGGVPTQGAGAPAGAAKASDNAGPVKLIGLPLTWAFVAFNIFVLVWMVMSSLKTSSEIFEVPWNLPEVIQWENFVIAWRDGNFSRAVLNTVLLTIGTAVATIAVAAPAAYVLSRFKVVSASPMTMYFAIGIGIPAQLVILPLYAIMNQFGMVNSLWGLWVLYVATSLPFAVFFLTGFFASLPGELEEAAMLDGASAFQTFRIIMLPLARSGIVTLAILNTIAHWNETIFALVFLQTDDRMTLSVTLLNFMKAMQYNNANWGGLFAGVCILVLPVLAIYLWLGRQIIEGMTLGADK